MLDFVELPPSSTLDRGGIVATAVTSNGAFERARLETRWEVSRIALELVNAGGVVQIVDELVFGAGAEAIDVVVLGKPKKPFADERGCGCGLNEQWNEAAVDESVAG